VGQVHAYIRAQTHAGLVTGHVHDPHGSALPRARAQVKKEKKAKKEKKEKKLHADLTGLASIWGSTRAAQAALQHFERSGKGIKVDDE
jgi:hypothetical protein